LGVSLLFLFSDSNDLSLNAAQPYLHSLLRYVLNHLFRKFRHPNLQNKIESLFSQ